MRCLCFLLVVFSIYINFVSSSDVLEFTDANFQDEIKKHQIILVEFFAPWCGHCKRLAPEYEKAATKLKASDLSIAKVDCTIEKETCKAMGITGYPTLKVFKNGEFSNPYESERSADAIVKYLLSQSGPSSKELVTIEQYEALFETTSPFIVGFFANKEGPLYKAFMESANSLRGDFVFAHSFNEDILNKAGYKDDVIIFNPKLLQNKFEENQKRYDGGSLLSTWIKENYFGLAGVLDSTNAKYFSHRPLIVAYYRVNYELNAKQTNYWRNRILKVAKDVKDELKSNVHFAISNIEDSNDLISYGVNSPDFDSVYIVAKDESDKKYIMNDPFSVENFEKWLKSFLNGDVEAYLKSEEIPDNSQNAVKVVVAKNFDSIVNDPTKDVLIEFYAPWCGHCKTLEPKYKELAEKLIDEPEITIAKMDATANDIPAPFIVKGFPTLFFVPKGNKQSPEKYTGGRDVNDFVKYLAGASTSQLSGYDRSGKPKKTDL